MQCDFDTSFASGLHSDYRAVAADVVQVVRALIPGAPPRGERGIMCLHNVQPDAVPCVQWPSPPTQYRIWLAGVGDRDYCKIAYQLSHELGHVMMDPSRSNGAVEMLAFAVSLESLSQLATRWAATPPYPEWRDFAANFRSHREQAINDELATVPKAVRDAAKAETWDVVAQHLLTQRSVLDVNPSDRPLNMLGALYLIGNGVPWAELLGLASKMVPDFASAPSFCGNAPFVPTEIPDWLDHIWARRS